MPIKKGETFKGKDGKVYQVTEVTPVGDAYIVVQFYIEGSRKQVDISNPNPQTTTTGERETVAGEAVAKLDPEQKAVKDLNR
jgi:hypothetical protein